MNEFNTNKNDFINHYNELKNNTNNLYKNNENVMDYYSLFDYYNRSSICSIINHFYKYYKNEAIQEFLKNGLDICAQLFINNQYSDIKSFNLKNNEIIYIVSHELQIIKILNNIKK